MKLYIIMLFFLSQLIGGNTNAQNVNTDFNTITEETPSVSMYFDWINRNWSGSNEHKALTDLDFFKWMKETYGMQLDVFLLDANVFDNGGFEWVDITGRKRYGNLSSPWFTKAYPNGFDKIFAKANTLGTRLGLWLGPDGYGDDEATAKARVELLKGLCRDYKMRLFKMDAACTSLDPKNEKYFVEALRRARKYTSDLILLNHRINLSKEALRQTTTFLWEGKETYIDVNTFNDTVAIHHREGEMKRGLPPGLQRLTEDHGVCLSSAMDFWEDALILQAFNRDLIMAPEIYGNPWLLKDTEFAALARIFNLHKRYNNILVNGKKLPENEYGYKAVSRGDDTTRLITLRNLSWNNITIDVLLDSSIGLRKGQSYAIVQYHPFEKYLGTFKAGSIVPVEVLPFRAALIKITTKHDAFYIEGSAYSVTKDMAGKPVEVTLLSMPGSRPAIKVNNYQKRFSKAWVDGKPMNEILLKAVTLGFDGIPLRQPYHRKLGTLQAGEIPIECAAIYETYCFANDNNALEVRSLNRAGSTKFESVKAARDAFFKDSIFLQTGSWDRFAFDGNSGTFFKTRATTFASTKAFKTYTKLKDEVMPKTALRIDMKSVLIVDSVVLQDVPSGYQPDKIEISADLNNWNTITFSQRENNILFSPGINARYIKVTNTPTAIAEIKAYKGGSNLADTSWRASNLFIASNKDSVKLAWHLSVTIKEAAKNSYLVLTVPGKYNPEVVFAGIKILNGIIAPTDRSPSFPYNNWEHLGFGTGNVSFYFPLTPAMLNQHLEVILLSTDASIKDIQPELWVTAYPVPFAEKKLILE